MRRLKILFFSHKFNPDIGGIESISEMLANAFVEGNADVRLITWSESKANIDFPYEVIRNPGKAELLKAFSWADVVFENNPCLRMSWPNILFGKPQVIGLQTWIGKPGDVLSRGDKLKRLWVRRASKVIACSEVVRKEIAHDAIVIGNPYNNKLFRKRPDVERGLDFVFLGRLVSDKGADLAIKAFAQYKKKAAADGNNTSLTIIGDGPELMTLKSIVGDNNLTDSVFFKGSLKGEALVECLNQHRFLLVPSLWREPFGIVALEGIACGCIPIVSDGGGLPDAVGKAGLVVKRGDVNELTEAMFNLKIDEQLQTNLKSAACVHLEEHECMNVAKRYLAVIETAVLNK